MNSGIGEYSPIPVFVMAQDHCLIVEILLVEALGRDRATLTRLLPFLEGKRCMRSFLKLDALDTVMSELSRHVHWNQRERAKNHILGTV